MFSVYYPYYMIEKVNKSQKKTNQSQRTYNHKINLRMLSLFCDNILIPCRHLLTMKDEDFNDLTENRILFEKRIIYFRLPQDINSISDYYESIKLDIREKLPFNVQARINKLNTIFSNNINSIDRYRPTEQMAYYADIMKDFLVAYAERKSKGVSELQTEIEKQSNFTKELFDNLLREYLQNGKITKPTETRLQKASNAIYFLAGATTGPLYVCYDKFFDNSCIQKELLSAASNYYEVITQIYNPQQICRFLKNVDIISEAQELETLSWENIYQLKQDKYFKKAINAYMTLNKSKEREKRIYSINATIKIIRQTKNILFSLIVGGIVAVISYIMGLNILMNIIFSSASTIITFFITLFTAATAHQVPIIGKFIDTIVGKWRPLPIYLLNIQRNIKQNNST